MAAYYVGMRLTVLLAVKRAK